MMSADFFNKRVNFDIDNRTESSHLPLVLEDMVPLNAETTFTYSKKTAVMDTFVQNVTHLFIAEEIHSLYADIADYDKILQIL